MSEVGSENSRDLSQWYTPYWMIHALCNWMAPEYDLRTNCVLLDPAAGDGRLISVAQSHGIGRAACAFDIDPKPRTRDQEIRRLDFLTDPFPMDVEPTVTLMNPPYEGHTDIAFLERALDITPKVIAIVRQKILHNKLTHDRLLSRYRLNRILAFPRPKFEGLGSGHAESEFVAIDISHGRPRLQDVTWTSARDFGFLYQRKTLKWVQGVLDNYDPDTATFDEYGVDTFIADTGRGKWSFVRSIVGGHVDQWVGAPFDGDLRGEYLESRTWSHPERCLFWTGFRSDGVYDFVYAIPRKPYT